MPASSDPVYWQFKAAINALFSGESAPTILILEYDAGLVLVVPLRSLALDEGRQKVARAELPMRFCFDNTS